MGLIEGRLSRLVIRRPRAGRWWGGQSRARVSCLQFSAALVRYVLCMKCAGGDPRPSTPSAPLASPPEPAVSARARQTPTAGIKTAGEPSVTLTAIKNRRAAAARLPQCHHRRRVARRRRVRCELSLSNGVKASALVSQSCRTVMLLNAISQRRRSGSQR